MESRLETGKKPKLAPIKDAATKTGLRTFCVTGAEFCGMRGDNGEQRQHSNSNSHSHGWHGCRDVNTHAECHVGFGEGDVAADADRELIRILVCWKKRAHRRGLAAQAGAEDAESVARSA